MVQVVLPTPAAAFVTQVAGVPEMLKEAVMVTEQEEENPVLLSHGRGLGSGGSPHKCGFGSLECYDNRGLEKDDGGFGCGFSCGDGDGRSFGSGNGHAAGADDICRYGFNGSGYVYASDPEYGGGAATGMGVGDGEGGYF